MLRHRRWAFLFLIAWVPLVILIKLQLIETVYVINIGVFVTSLAILINCPELILKLHEKPLYAEDLLDHDSQDIKKYQRRYVYGIIILLSISSVVVSDYILFTLPETNMTIIQVVFLTGGGLKVYTALWNIYKDILIAIMFYHKQRYSFSPTVTAASPQMEPPKEIMIEMHSLLDH